MFGMDEELTEDELQALLLEPHDDDRPGWDEEEYDFTPR